jgi:fatty-acid desaturase
MQTAIVRIRIAMLWDDQSEENDVLAAIGAILGCATFSVLLTPVMKAGLTLLFKRSVSQAVQCGAQEAMLLPTDIVEAVRFIGNCLAGRLARQERFLQFIQGMQISVGWFWMYGYCSLFVYFVFVLPASWLYSLKTDGRIFLESRDIFWTFILTQFFLLCTNVCFHRYFAHNVFHASRPVQFVIAVMGALGGQRGAVWWGSAHRQHHQHCDTEEDIHSPYYGGFLWSHAGWLFDRRSYTIPRASARHLETHYELWLFEPLAAIITSTAYNNIAAILDIDRSLVWLAWVCSLHLEFCINSLCHFCTKSEKSAECTPRDIVVLGLLNAGEGFHGGHHERPWCAKHAWRQPWWVPDLSYILICVLEAFCLVSNVQHPGCPDTRNADPKMQKSVQDRHLGILLA